MERENTPSESRMSALSIVLSDEDFALPQKPQLPPSMVDVSVAEPEMVAEAEPIETLRSLLPKVIARKLLEMVPDGFALKKITFEGEVSGKPFGVGLGGKVSVEFEKG